GSLHHNSRALNPLGCSRDRIAPWNICPLEPSKPRRFAYVAAQKERRRKHRTEVTVDTEDVLPWVFCVFFGGQTRESPVLKAGLATSRFSRSEAAEQSTVQFVRAHRITI